MSLETRKIQEASIEEPGFIAIGYCPLCKNLSIHIEGTDTGEAHQSYGHYFAVCSECDYKVELSSD